MANTLQMPDTKFAESHAALAVFWSRKIELALKIILLVWTAMKF